ncbi:MAG: tRNA (guanosine(37)-N1)-methyltransferase TrmD [Synergistaceae bacterium]|jgi:tRNA (guanine37-N1)-methyltransferase|nr:tRNA (guanosine(37)-N1)-methyltransferase TrmD [Synergistaceae bacterium]
MRFTVITAFPDFFRDFISASVVGRGIKKGLVEVQIVDLRSFGKGVYRQVDDYAFGSGGMVLMAQPLKEALDAARRKAGEKSFVVYPTPQGALLTQEIVESLFRQGHVTIVCGHYEGIDERFVESEVDLEVTIGDCVLTGGEIPAMAVIDAVSRLVPGVVGKSGAVVEDSFYRGMLDHPHYTRPASWNGKDAPEVLLSGNAGEICRWRREQAVLRTLSRRPDLVSKCSLREYMGGGFYLAIECEDMAGLDGERPEGRWPDERFIREQVGEWAKLCESYGAARLVLIVKNAQDRDFARAAFKAEAKADKIPGSSKVKWMPSLARTLEWALKKESRLLLVGVSDEVKNGAKHWLELKRFILEKCGSVLFYFPAESRCEGNFEEVDFEKLEKVAGSVFMIPLQGGRLPLFGKISAVLDRFLGSK